MTSGFNQLKDYHAAQRNEFKPIPVWLTQWDKARIDLNNPRKNHKRLPEWFLAWANAQKTRMGYNDIEYIRRIIVLDDISEKVLCAPTSTIKLK